MVTQLFDHTYGILLLQVHSNGLLPSGQAVEAILTTCLESRKEQSKSMIFQCQLDVRLVNLSYFIIS